MRRITLPTGNFFNCCKNIQKAIKLQMQAWKLIKRKFNLKISKFINIKSNQIDQRVVLGNSENSLCDG